MLRQSQSLVSAGVPHVLPARRLLGLWDVVRRVPFMDAVVFGGGSLFQDRSSRMSLAYYLLILTWACLWRRRILVLGHGLGPIRSGFLSWWLSCVLPHVDRVVARDSQSYMDFLSLGSRSECTVLGTDLAYVSERQPDRWAGDGVVAVSVNGPLLPMFESALKAGAAGACDFLWIVMHEGHDDVRDPHVRMLSDLSLDDVGATAKRSFEAIGSGKIMFRACISMRYHACVWASLCGVPFLAVGDDPKLKALATMFGQPMASLTLTKHEMQTEISGFLGGVTAYRQCVLATLPDVLADAKKTVWI